VEHEAWVQGNPQAVAKALPKPYAAFTDSSGNPLVFARAEHCAALDAGSGARPTTIADWGVVVKSPDGFGCASGTPEIGTTNGDAPPICNWYPLAMVTDNRNLIAWLHDGTPALPISFAPHLTYQEAAPDPLGRASFHFTMSHSPAAFSLDDTDEFLPAQLSLRGGYWFTLPRGTTKLDVSTDDLTPGRADSVLQAPAGSPLAQLMGATQRSQDPPYEEFGVIRVGHGVLRKEMFGPMRRGEHAERFAGSCSAEGNVTFDPPVTNTSAVTTYNYTSAGTCDGTLDGKAVSGLAVRIQHSGRADASCMQGLAFPPGTGKLTFAGHSALIYTLDFETNATEIYGTFYGTRSGQADAHATFLNDRASPTIAQDCATTGVKKAPLDFSFTTQQDLVSDTPQGMPR
jgi:hypothetical protein